MKSNYRRIGEFIKRLNNRNKTLETTNLLGININKYFMPSVANVQGTDLSKYKLVQKNQFACNRMHVGRDERLPIALSNSDKNFIVSPAYDVFEIIEEEELLPEYLMMWFSRKEFDRNTWFYTDSDVRGKLGWEDFCNMELPVPSIEKQRAIVQEYNTIANRIKLNEQLNQKLEETAQALYKYWFVDFEFPDENGLPYKSSGGEMIWNEELEKEIPMGWKFKQLDEITKVVDSLHKTPKYSSKGYPMVRVTDINKGLLDLSNTMLVEQTVFDDFSKNHKSCKGDIIVSRVGATYGQFSYAHTNKKFCLGQNTAVIIPTIIDSKLLYTTLTSSSLRGQIEKLVSGSAYSTLSLKDIRGLKIPLPIESTKTIIDNIVKMFDVIFEKRSVFFKEVALLKTWKTIMLSQMILNKTTDI